MAKRRKARNSRTRYKGNRTLLRVLKLGLQVTPRELAKFKPDTKDYVIAMAHLRGYPDACGVETYARNLVEEGENPIIEELEVQKRMEDPVRMTWLSTKLLECQEQQAGFFWAFIYQRAIRGDMQAAKLWATRFDRAFRPTTRHETVSANIDVSTVDDSTRQAMLARELRKFFGSPAETKIIDVTPVEADAKGTAKSVDRPVSGADSEPS